MLTRAPRIDVEAAAARGTEAIRLCQRWRRISSSSTYASRHDRSATTRAIRQAHPSTRVLVVTMHEDTDYPVSRLPSVVPQTHRRPGGEGCVLQLNELPAHEAADVVSISAGPVRRIRRALEKPNPKGTSDVERTP